MRNDTQVKVSCITKENQDELHFDYYDKEGTMVGTISVNQEGCIRCKIWNEDYQEHIMNIVSIFYGAKIENTDDFILAANERKPIYWENANDFIAKSGLVVNFYQNDYFNEEFQNGAKKR